MPQVPAPYEPAHKQRGQDSSEDLTLPEPEALRDVVPVLRDPARSEPLNGYSEDPFEQPAPLPTESAAGTAGIRTSWNDVIKDEKFRAALMRKHSKKRASLILIVEMDSARKKSRSGQARIQHFFKKNHLFVSSCGWGVLFWDKTMPKIA